MLSPGSGVTFGSWFIMMLWPEIKTKLPANILKLRTFEKPSQWAGIGVLLPARRTKNLVWLNGLDARKYRCPLEFAEMPIIILSRRKPVVVGVDVKEEPVWVSWW